MRHWAHAGPLVPEELGLLNIMGAGDKATYDRVKPVLDDLGENVFHLGDLGAGHTIKLLNNFFAMTTANASPCG